MCHPVVSFKCLYAPMSRVLACLPNKLNKIQNNQIVTYLSLFTVLICFLTLNPNDAFSQDEGVLTKRNIDHHGCKISSMTAKWSFRSLMGEPIKGGSYKWEAGYRTEEDCLSYKDFIILKVQSTSNSSAYAWVEIDPTVPKAGQGYSYNTSGSPSWNDLFCGFNRSGQKYNCWDEESAKKFWKGGFRVIDFKPKRAQ